MILRIEDIDASRVRPEATANAIADLKWLGLDWDEGPILQSSRLAIYDMAIERLKLREAVYPCTCTRAEIARASSAPHAEDEGPAYPGTCAGRSAADATDLTMPYCWRFRAPSREIIWEDLIAGRIMFTSSQMGGDFIVGRSQGQPSYQLAVVCDDAMMGVSQVVRGDDLIPSTPRQILLYESLDWQPPEFGHIALVHDSEGHRLAKRDGAIKIATLREQGVSSNLLIGMLAKSLGMTERVVTSTPHDWLRAFQFETIPKSPWMLPHEITPWPIP